MGRLARGGPGCSVSLDAQPVNTIGPSRTYQAALAVSGEHARGPETRERKGLSVQLRKQALGTFSGLPRTSEPWDGEKTGVSFNSCRFSLK